MMPDSFEKKGFYFQYQGEQPFSLTINHISFKKGEIVFLHGRSGCGKTTLMDLLSGVQKSIVEQEVRAVFKNIGYVMHESTLLPWTTIQKNIKIEEKLRKRQHNKEYLLSLCQLFSLDQTIFNKNASDISLGMRQRIEIAKALSFEPDILLLDEAFSGIDAITKARVIKSIIDAVQKMGICVVGTAHQIGDLLRMAEKIYWLEDGAIKKIIEVKESPHERIDMTIYKLYSLRAAYEIMS
jgi:ABC-type nitrate/sulfonate/bicarbonate transport system ATPase subunit